MVLLRHCCFSAAAAAAATSRGQIVCYGNIASGSVVQFQSLRAAVDSRSAPDVN